MGDANIAASSFVEKGPPEFKNMHVLLFLGPLGKLTVNGVLVLYDLIRSISLVIRGLTGQLLKLSETLLDFGLDIFLWKPHHGLLIVLLN